LGINPFILKYRPLNGKRRNLKTGNDADSNGKDGKKKKHTYQGIE
jgi:hypothetical protein